MESVHIEPSYDYKYTDKYTDPMSSTNYVGSITATNNYTYTPSPYATDSYTTNNYSITNNINNYSSSYPSNTESNGNNTNYGSYTSYTSTGIAPVSTYQNV